MAGILLLAHDRSSARALRSMLRQDGHQVAWLRTIEAWREAERELRPDLVVAAVGSAQEVLGVHGPRAPGFPPPVLLVLNEAGFFHEVHLDDRLVDRIESPFMSEEFLARVDALIRVRRVVLRSAPDDGESVIERRSRGGLVSLGRRLAALLGTRVPRFDKPIQPYLEVAARIADWADRRDAFAPGHSERVTSFAAMIAEGLRLPNEESSALLRAAMLHDIGKVALPSDVLRWRGPLGPEHKRLLRTHPQRGAALLRALDRDEEVVQAILWHHEQPDGAGYYGRRPGSIPRAAAILGVAEAYDAMTSTQLMQPLSPTAAIDRLRELRGQKFDAECVDALIAALRPRAGTIPLSRN